MSTLSVPSIAKPLLGWYDVHRRQLPWRAAPGEAADPYRVWLSEIMLQQTTVATVGPYYGDFLARWPTVGALASADLDEVLHAWQGLGYYSRARNLHKCARAVVAEHGGQFPETEAELKQLPGIGPYTAAAVAAIAFGRKASPVDGNIERVMARLHALETPLPAAKPEIKNLAEAHTPDERAGDYAQALMDLGATVCKPKTALCGDCPLSGGCRAAASADPGRFPLRAPKKQRPTRHGVVFWLERSDGAVMLRRRPEEGLLGGMMEFPSTEWREDAWVLEAALPTAPADADWRPMPGTVAHTFTHFHLELEVVTGRVAASMGANQVWARPAEFADYALPTVMKKVARFVAAQRAGGSQVVSGSSG